MKTRSRLKNEPDCHAGHASSRSFGPSVIFFRLSHPPDSARRRSEFFISPPCESRCFSELEPLLRGLIESRAYRVARPPVGRALLFLRAV